MDPYRSQLFLGGRTDRVNQLAHLSLIDGRDNTCVGVNTTALHGSLNTVVGARAGALDARSARNVLVGAHAGANAHTATDTVGMGVGTLANARLARQSVFVGHDTGATARNVALCTAVGFCAGSRLSTALRTTLVGSHSGQFAFNNTDDTFVGHASGRMCREGARNTCLGAFSGQRMDVGADNVLVGHRAGANILAASLCVAVGAQALEFAPNASNVVAIGAGAGRFAAGARDAIFIGGWGRDAAGNVGGNAGGIAANAVYVGMGTGLGGSDNVAMGTRTLPVVRGDRNVALGTAAGGRVHLGSDNVLIGPWAGAYVEDDSRDVLVGAFCGNAGSNNTCVGYAAASLVGGGNNSCVGVGVGPVGGAWDNVVVGAFSAVGLRGNANAILGSGAARVGDASRSIFVGAGASGSLVAGSDNIVIGTDSCAALRGANTIVVGCRSCPSLVGNDNVIVGTGHDMTGSFEGVTLVGSAFNVDYDFGKLQDAVVIGRNVTITNRDSNCVVINNPALGDVIRATPEAVTFGAGVRVLPSSTAVSGPSENLILARYVPGANAAQAHAAMVSTTQPGLWYETVAPPPLHDAADAYMADHDRRMYGPSTASMRAPLDASTTSETYLVHPTFLGNVTNLSTTLTNKSIWIEFAATGAGTAFPPVKVQGVSYNKLFVHFSGMCCLSSVASSVALTVTQFPIPNQRNLLVQSWVSHSIDELSNTCSTFGPTLHFPVHPAPVLRGSQATECSVFKITGVPIDADEVVSVIPGVQDRYGSATVIRWEGFSTSSPDVVIMELTFFEPKNRNDDTLIRMVWSPYNWPSQLGQLYFAGVDGCRLASLPLQAEAPSSSPPTVRAVYFVPPSAPVTTPHQFSSWVATSVPQAMFSWTPIQLPQPMKLFGKEYYFAFAFTDGTIAFGRPLKSSDVPCLRLGYAASSYPQLNFARVGVLMGSSYRDRLNAFWDAAPLAPSSIPVVRLEFVGASSSPFIVELWLAPDGFEVVYTDTVRNAWPDARFELAYKNSTYPVPHSAGRSYTVSTNNLPPHVFAGGRVVLDNSGVSVTGGVFNGDAGMLSNINPRSIATPGTVSGNGYVSTMSPGASNPGMIHNITAADIVDSQATLDFAGQLGVFVTNQHQRDKMGHVLLGVIRTPFGFQAQVQAVHHTAALSTLLASANSEGVWVQTDTGCRVSWKFDGAVFTNSA